MTRRLMVTMIAVAALAMGQAEKEKQADAERAAIGPRVQKVFQVKHADVDSLWNAFNHIANVRVDKNLKLLVVSGTPESVKAIEDALKTLDVPPAPAAVKNVELTFHMILAKPYKNGSLPAGLEAVQKNLEGIFGFKGFHLLETVFLRSRNGVQAEASGVAPNPHEAESPMKVTYQLRVSPSVAPGEGGAVVRLDQLRFGLRMPVITGTDSRTNKLSFEYRDAGINTQIDVREGQRVVVGKANVNATDGALVLVVSAKVVD